MKETLEEWSEISEAHKLLKENLEANIKVYCPDMGEEERAVFLRMNLIMVRQFLGDVKVCKAM